jgi:nucleotide-binding universal stress UspA family protein
MNQRMKLLIGYDGSSCSDALVADLERAGLPDECEVIVMSVAEVWLPSPSTSEPSSGHEPVAVSRMRAHARELIAAALEIAREGASRIAGLFPGWSVTAEALADSPAWGLLARADAWEPDLMIVGSHGRSAIGRLLLGSVSQKVVTEARCPVRVVRDHSFVPGSPCRIVIGMDGSSDAREAVGTVARRAWPAGSAVRLVAALDPIYSRVIPPSEGVEEGGAVEQGGVESEWEWVGKVLESSVAELRGAGLEAMGVVREIDPRRALVEDAEQWGADAIFVGARGIGPLERFLLGSVSAAVAARAGCPVEIVRPGRRSP